MNDAQGESHMANKDLVKVKVLDLPGISGGCACSNPSLTPEYAAMLQQKVAELKAALEESFPGQTGVEYVDLREHPAEKESELGQLLSNKKYPPPLVAIDGEPKFAGSIQVKKRTFAQNYPTITIDGCDKLCAAKATEMLSGKPSKSLSIPEILKKHGLTAPTKLRHFGPEEDAAVKAVATEIARAVDEVLEDE
jgi:disulfide oxidoreductase YuzD